MLTFGTRRKRATFSDTDLSFTFETNIITTDSVNREHLAMNRFTILSQWLMRLTCKLYGRGAIYEITDIVLLNRKILDEDRT